MHPPRTMARSFALLPLSLALLLVVAACDDDPVSPETPRDIAIALSPAALTMSQGESTPISVILTSTGGYTGTVIIAAENSPDGVSIEGGVIVGGSGTAQLDVVTSAGALLGTANIRIRAIGQGVSETSAVLALTVEAGP
jgi:hypothetical protein